MKNTQQTRIIRLTLDECRDAIAGLRDGVSIAVGSQENYALGDAYDAVATKINDALRRSPPEDVGPTLTRADVLWTLRALENVRRRTFAEDDATTALAQTYDALIAKYGAALGEEEPDIVFDDAAIRSWAAQHGFELCDDGARHVLGRVTGEGMYLVLSAAEGPSLPPIRGPVGYTLYTSIEAWSDSQAPTESGQAGSLTNALLFVTRGALERRQAD